MFARLFGVLALVISILLIGTIINDVDFLMKIRVKHYDVTSFRVSQLPYGKQLSGDVCHTIHIIDDEIVSDIMDDDILEMPDFHLVNDIDISNLMPRIEREFGVSATSISDRTLMIEGRRISTCVRKVMPGSLDGIITVIGKLDGSRYDLGSVYVYHNDSDNPTIPIFQFLTTRVLVIFLAVILGIKYHLLLV